MTSDWINPPAPAPPTPAQVAALGKIRAFSFDISDWLREAARSPLEPRLWRTLAIDLAAVLQLVSEQDNDEIIVYRLAAITIRPHRPRLVPGAELCERCGLPTGDLLHRPVRLR